MHLHALEILKIGLSRLMRKLFFLEIFNKQVLVLMDESSCLGIAGVHGFESLPVAHTCLQPVDFCNAEAVRLIPI